MSDVFVSYKAEDRRRVRRLVDALVSEGFSVWWDEQIGGGTTWRHAIEAELNAAKCVIVVWSNRSIGPDGSFVQDEATRAQARHVYVPVLIDKVDLPLGFGETQALPLIGWHGNRSDPKYQAVLATVRRTVGHLVSPSPVSSPHVNRRTTIAAGIAAAVTIGGAGAWALEKHDYAVAEGHSIAVLPFENLSGDPSQAYFSDGLAEELRSALARIPQLKVVARTSSEAVRNDDAKTAAQKLGVATILTGSVRRSSQLIRVDTQLVDGRTGLERWSQTFDRPLGDVLAIQTNIATSVADALSIRLGELGKAALQLGGTTNVAAQDLYLQADPARPNGTPEGILRSVAQLDAAIQLDPNYARAYARKGAALSTYGGTFAKSRTEGQSYFDQAVAAATRAIQLAPRLPEGHAALSYVYRNELRLRESDKQMQIAVSLPGADAITWSGYALFLADEGGGTDALNAASRATKLDPLNAAVFANKAFILFVLHQYALAIAAARQALTIDPSRAAARRYLAYSLIFMHRFDEAASELSKLPSDSVQARTALAIVAAYKGDLKTSDRLISQMQQDNGDSANYQYAQVYAQRKNVAAAIDYLNRAIAVHDPGLSALRVDPFLDPVRSDPRFIDLLRKTDFDSA